ncbi:MAG: AAA family ATPase [Faecousia sp.]
MSDFLKFAFEIISQVVYYFAELLAAAAKLLVTGWRDYFTIFFTYFPTVGILGKILSILLMLILVAIPVLAIFLLVRSAVLRHRLKKDKVDNTELYREIGRLNRQVLNLIDEKNKILALKVNTMGGTERIPYMGASALTDDTLPTVGNVTGLAKDNAIASAQINVANGTVNGTSDTEADSTLPPEANRFPKLALVDQKYREYIPPLFDDEITLEQVVDGYRSFACSQMHLYYTPEIIRRFVAGMASSKLLILEGISGTGKTSLPHSFSRFLENPATMVSVQPSFRDRTELLGYFNEFSKRFNETEFLRALYEAGYRQEPSMVILDEMNLARIEYYFAEMLSVLEMPSHDEWVLDLVPTAWPGDPELLFDGKIQVPDSIWFIGTANNDDSTFTITDKVYDRAMPIELNERAAPFECEPQGPCRVTSAHLQALFEKAKQDYPITPATQAKLEKLDGYLQTRFKLAFGNRIIKQMHDFIPVYVACGGKELDGMDYIVARKVLKKLESLNITFVRDEIRSLIEYIEKVFGKTNMPDSKAYLNRIQNLF